MSRPDVWVSVDFAPGRRFRSCFDTAFELRSVLRRSGYVANLFSVTEPLDGLRPAGADVVFPVAERVAGRPGDPFSLRRALEERGVAVVGSPHGVVKAASDKARARRVLAAAGFAVPAGVVLPRADLAAAEVFTQAHGFPVVAKPCVGGGSAGVEYLSGASALRDWVRRHEASAGPPMLLERYVTGRELTAWVVDCGEVLVRTIEIVKHDAPLFDRAQKAGPQGNRLPGPGRVSVRRAALPWDVNELVQATAVGVHRLFGARAYSRTDLILHGDRAMILELNTTPRLRRESILQPFTPADPALGFDRLVAALVDEASARVRGAARRSAVVAGP